MASIEGKEYPLKEVFSKEFEYHIPSYQRPYAWTKEEAGQLLDDLFDFYKEEKNENYFLGSIVLIKKKGEPFSDVIDGQQRLTTLTILLSVIASKLQEGRSACENYLREPGNTLEELKPQPRLYLREKDQEFFNKYIQNVKIEELQKLDDKQIIKTESQKNIKDNCGVFLEKIEHFEQGELLDFCKFIVSSCYLVVVFTPTQESAFRIFSVMNSRGLPLLPTDIIKSDIIGKIPKEEQKKYTEKWEELEVNIGRSGFNNLFSHIRTIYAKSKAKQNLLEEFKSKVLEKVQPKELIDNLLDPYAYAYNMLVNKKYDCENTNDKNKVNHYLFWLNMVENSDWFPVAIKFMADRKNDSEYIEWLFRKLERLTSYLFITSKNVNKRIERYSKILDEMEACPNHSYENPLSSIELNNDEKKELMSILNDDIYTLAAIRRNFIILRLNVFVSDDGVNFDYEPNVLTIEHVLPQTVDPKSEWAKIWTDELKQKWLNKLANLVPLTRKKNSEAQNFDFKIKKEKYFTGSNGTSTYALTTQVLNEPEWTEEVVSKRQKELLAKFSEKWELKYEEKNEEVVDDVKSSHYFIKNKRGANAEGYSIENGFLVLAKSRISNDVIEGLKENYKNAYEIREDLIKKGIVVDNVFQEDFKFHSISLAASVILGRNASGPKEWVNDRGISFENDNNK